MWLVLGVGLLIVEMVTGTFVLMFFSLGCFAAAIADYVGATDLNIEIGICAIISLLGVVIWRKTLQNKLLKQINVSTDIGKEIEVTLELLPHKTSRIPYQGTTWQAINLDSEVIRVGQRAMIVGIDGNTLLIRKVN